MTSHRLPPGPQGLWSAPKRFLDYCRDPIGDLKNKAKQFGDVVRLPSFGFEMYMLNHPDDIEEVLRHKHRLFKKDFYMEALRPMLGNGLVSSDGEEWRRQRSMSQPAFGVKQIQQYAPTMLEQTQVMLARYRDGQTRDIHADMMRLTLGIVTKTLFNVDLDDEAGHIGHDLEAAMTFYAHPLAMWPWWRKVPTPTNLRFRKTLKRLDAVIYQMIGERRSTGNFESGDLLSRLLAARDEQGRSMSNTELRDQLMTLFLAGHETTALTLSYTFYLLAKNPQVEQSLRAELDAILGDRLPTLDDVPQLTYAEAVIKESMRVYSPVWAIGREAIEDCEIAGYFIPKGAQILMMQCIVHSDPRFWPEPERFRPERWNEERTKALPRCAYFPFGDGPRICIGNGFAMMEAILLLTSILQRFRFELPPGETLELVPSITLRPKHGIKMVAHAVEPTTGYRTRCAEADYVRA